MPLCFCKDSPSKVWISNRLSLSLNKKAKCVTSRRIQQSLQVEYFSWSLKADGHKTEIWNGCGCAEVIYFENGRVCKPIKTGTSLISARYHNEALALSVCVCVCVCVCELNSSRNNAVFFLFQLSVSINNFFPSLPHRLLPLINSPPAPLSVPLVWRNLFIMYWDICSCCVCVCVCVCVFGFVFHHQSRWLRETPVISVSNYIHSCQKQAQIDNRWYRRFS